MVELFSAEIFRLCTTPGRDEGASQSSWSLGGVGYSDFTLVDGVVFCDGAIRGGRDGDLCSLSMWGNSFCRFMGPPRVVSYGVTSLPEKSELTEPFMMRIQPSREVYYHAGQNRRGRQSNVTDLNLKGIRSAGGPAS